MYLHANAKLGLAGRLSLVRAIEGGLSQKQAAACFSVSPATVHRWWHRWLDGGRQPQALLDRSSRPHRSRVGSRSEDSVGPLVGAHHLGRNPAPITDLVTVFARPCTHLGQIRPAGAGTGSRRP